MLKDFWLCATEIESCSGGRCGQKEEKANKVVMIALKEMKSVLASKHDECMFGLANGSIEILIHVIKTHH